VSRPRVHRFIAPVLVVISLVYLPKLGWPASVVYTRVLTDEVLSVIASVCKLLALGGGAVFAGRSAATLHAGNPVRTAWWTLAVALASFATGQLVLSTYQLVLRIPLPLPSLGDAFFLCGYPMMTAAFVQFIRVYRASGFPLGHPREPLFLALGAGVAFAVIGYPVLAPIARAPHPLPERLINIAYPLLDFVALVPTVLLLRITARFRGGRVWAIWATILSGFVFASGGDILFAYFTSKGLTALEPVVDWMFIGSYFLLAVGVAQQHELLTD
jgi:hypothetical protein